MKHKCFLRKQLSTDVLLMSSESIFTAFHASNTPYAIFLVFICLFSCISSTKQEKYQHLEQRCVCLVISRHQAVMLWSYKQLHQPSSLSSTALGCILLHVVVFLLLWLVMPCLEGIMYISTLIQHLLVFPFSYAPLVLITLNSCILCTIPLSRQEQRYYATLWLLTTHCVLFLCQDRNRALSCNYCSIKQNHAYEA